MTRRALTKDQKEAVKTERAATTLVASLNEKIYEQQQTVKQLGKSLKDTQDNFENLRAEYYSFDKRNAILELVNEYSVGVEVVKFFIAGGAGYGINLASSGQLYGWAIFGGSAIAYIAITKWQNKLSQKTKNETDK